MDMFQLCHESGPFPPQDYAPILLLYESFDRSPLRLSPVYPPFRLCPLAPYFFNVFGVSITFRRYPRELEEKILKALCDVRECIIVATNGRLLESTNESIVFLISLSSLILDLLGLSSL